MTVSPDVPTGLHGDGLRLAQVLLNLVGNAVKFTAVGGVDVAVTRLPDRGADWLRFTVRDSGIGIAPRDIARLFGSFEQADASTTRRYGGSGLGLAICQSLVELMGGTIAAESHVAEGSAFMVDVPLPPAQVEPGTRVLAPTAEPRIPISERSAAASRPGARVLLAEDSTINQQVASELLRLAGVLVDTVPDGRSAVEAARTTSYDLILMDVQMPILDGLAATREIRRLPGRRDVPIVAMTANAFEDDRRACLDAGMNDHLAKPVDPDRLYGTLERWVPARLEASQTRSLTGAVARRRDAEVDREAAAMRTLLGASSGNQQRTVTDAGHGNGTGPGRSGTAAPGGNGNGLGGNGHAGHRGALDAAPGADLLDAIARIPGIDAGPWLGGGTRARTTYVDLLARFPASHGGDVTEIRTRVLAGDMLRARRPARTLERVANALGLVELEASAASLVAALDAGDDPGMLEERIVALDARLAGLLAALDAVGLVRVTDAAG
jgi:CheY-like chemotaxis protein